MRKVGIFKAGYCPMDTQKLCALLNRKSASWSFVEGSADLILGEPDLADYAFSTTKISNLVERQIDPFDQALVVMAAPLEGDYFLKSAGRNLVIATLKDTTDVRRESGRSVEEYVAITALAEFLSFEYEATTGRTWRDLFHSDPRGCIFDFAGVKDQMSAKLAECRICPGCRTKFSANVPEPYLLQVNEVLERIRRPSITRAFSKAVTKPGLSFFYGGLVFGAAVNAFSSLVLSPEPNSQQIAISVIVALLIPVFPLGVFCWDFANYLYQKRYPRT